MLPADNHVHSQWSFDTDDRASMARACARAVDLGVPSVAFTEHVDALRWEPADEMSRRGLEREVWHRVRPLDVDGYLACIAECRERFPQLRILTGIEIGEPHLYAATVAGVLARGRFDRILGSLHVVPLGRELLEAYDALQEVGPDRAAEAMRTYFAELLRLVEGSDSFEILAHLDYPRRYWPDDAEPYAEQDFEPEYRAVLRALAGSGRVLEVNTASPLACVDLLRWWRDEGGRAVSFGSDAHVPWRVGEHFALAVDVVEAAGFGPGGDPFDFWRR